MMVLMDNFEPINKTIPKSTYTVYQYEMVNNLHIQGYVRFEHARTLSGLRKILEKWSGEKGPHLEIANGTPLENKEYCTKLESRKYGPFEFGDVPTEDEKPEMVKAMEYYMENGMTNEFIAKWPTYATMYSNKWKQMKLENETINWKPRQGYKPPEVIVLWGKTRTGKTRQAVQDGALIIPAVKSDNMFTHYKGDKVVCFDDFRGKIDHEYLLQLLDGHQTYVKILYQGFKPWIPEKIYITSNRHPKDWYPELKPEEYEALIARFTKLEHLTGEVPQHVTADETIPTTTITTTSTTTEDPIIEEIVNADY